MIGRVSSWRLALALLVCVNPARVARAADDPPPPTPPAVIARDASLSRATARAVKLTAPIRIDGKLDEAVYASAQPMNEFIQVEPRSGQPATEKTDVWVFFDRDSIYVVGRCWDSQPARDVADEMRRDNGRVVNNENFAFTFDTFHDRRSGYDFEVNPLGGRWDGEIADDAASINGNPNPVWQLATGRFEGGWVVEARIPFKSLRYAAGAEQVWGFQVRRMVRWKNEISFLTLIPAAIGQRGHLKVSLSASLVGLEVPPAGKNLEIKPYAIASVATDMTARPVVSNDPHADWGGDVKYGLSKTLKADVTYNTDFAQVEADLQQVNLTRFSLFFPEKRDFFLENSGAFGFGAATGSDNAPALFYSRRIGLAGSQIVPIVAGGRLSGRAGRFSLGLLNMESGEQAAAGVRKTNFSVVRIKRDVFRRSSVGMIYTGRSVSQNGVGSNHAYGVDGQFLLTNLAVANLFWARTHTPGRSTDDTSYRAQFDYEGDRYGALVEQLAVGANFNPDIGFVRHPDLRRSYGSLRFSPRPRRSNKTVRKFYYTGTGEYIRNGAGRVDTRAATAEVAVELQNSDKFNVKYFRTYEFLPARLTLAPGVTVPVGGYDYQSVLAGYNFGPARKRGLANLSIERGTLYGGDKTTFTVASGLVSVPPHIIVEPTYSMNRVSLRQGAFTAHLLGPRLTYMATPLLFLSALVQYNSTAHNLAANVRFRWEYQLGSELFVVLNNSSDTAASAHPGLQNRALIVKINRLFRF